MGAKASKIFSILHFDSLTAASEICNFFIKIAINEDIITLAVCASSMIVA